MKPTLRHIEVLGTPVACADYDQALRTICSLAGSGRASAVCASNTHIVSMARHNRGFGAVMRGFDLVLPDGMPLIWYMNRQGAGLTDRVYGPYFMRHALQHLGRPWKHFFFGGSEECLRDLMEAARRLQPDLDLVGSYSPPFRSWREEDEAEFARVIQKENPDFIWVALGGERQERWISRNLHRHGRGVFLAVGDAFELLAGRRPFAPDWMQRFGLTWVYRLWQEPYRLWGRYIRFNSLFLYYCAREWLASLRRLRRPSTFRQGLKIVFIGSRGVPARYSGFETVVEQLGARLAARGHQVTVYNRGLWKRDRRQEYRGMELKWLPTLKSKNLETVVHTLLCTGHVFWSDQDLIYLCGVGNAPLAGWLKIFKKTHLVINVDGADYSRSKWGLVARWWLKFSEWRATHSADLLVADNREIVRRYERDYGYTPHYLSYGAECDPVPVEGGEMKRWGLEEKQYILYVSRLTPENEADLLLEAYALLQNPLPLVITGAVGYEHEYFKVLQKKARGGVIFTGGRFGEAYRELSQKALFFVMPAAIEATRLVLLDQMGMGAAILYRDVPASREVLGGEGVAFGTGLHSRGELRRALAEKMTELSGDPERCGELGQRTLERARALYSWDAVTNEYEKLFLNMLGGAGSREHK